MRSIIFTARTLFERNWRRQSVLCTKSRMANHLYRRGATGDPNDFYHAFVLEVTLRQCVVVDFRHTKPEKTSLVAVVGSLPFAEVPATLPLPSLLKLLPPITVLLLSLQPQQTVSHKDAMHSRTCYCSTIINHHFYH